MDDSRTYELPIDLQSDDYITVTQAMDDYHYSRAAIYKIAASGRVDILKPRELKISRSSLERYIEEVNG